jgi:hypothetical protein
LDKAKRQIYGKIIYPMLCMFRHVGLFVALAVVAARGPPRLDQQFLVTSEEIDDTTGGNVILKQTIAIDPDAMRTAMIADGSMISVGHMEQIVRCDGIPIGGVGYFLNVGGPEGPRQVCQNFTRDCQPFQPFWSFPSNISYVGKVTHLPSSPSLMNAPPSFDKFVFWLDSERWEMYTSPYKDGDRPWWFGKVFTPVPNYHLWHILYRTYAPGPAPLTEFQLPKGTANCTKTPNTKYMSGAAMEAVFAYRQKHGMLTKLQLATTGKEA